MPHTFNRATLEPREGTEEPKQREGCVHKWLPPLIFVLETMAVYAIGYVHTRWAPSWQLPYNWFMPMNHIGVSVLLSWRAANKTQRIKEWVIHAAVLVVDLWCAIQQTLLFTHPQHVPTVEDVDTGDPHVERAKLVLMWWLLLCSCLRTFVVIAPYLQSCFKKHERCLRCLDCLRSGLEEDETPADPPKPHAQAHTYSLVPRGSFHTLGVDEI